MWALLWAVAKDLAHFVAESLWHTEKVPALSLLELVLVPETIYSADSPETLKIRLLLSNYNHELIQQPLTAAEYFLYRIRERKLGAPFTPGIANDVSFHESLKGKEGIYVTVFPKRDSIMELFMEDQPAQLLFVREVSDEETITVESVGLHTAGEYRIDIFTKPQWQKWRPVFITFSETNHNTVK